MRRLCLAVLLLLPTVGLTAEPADDPRFIKPPGTDLGLPFTPGILSDDFLFLSGAIGNQPGTKVVTGDMAAQTHQTLANLKDVLDAAGLDFSHVVETTVYLSDMRYIREMSRARSKYEDLYPASTLVEADVAIPNAFIEASAIAARPHLKIETITPDGWPEPRGQYRWAKKAGNTLFLAGQVGSNPKTGQLAGSDIKSQTRQVLANIDAILKAAGMSKKDVASCRVYLPDARDFSTMNELYREYFDHIPPARATTRARLASENFKIEIQCIAVAGVERKAVHPAGSTASNLPFSPAIRAGNRLYLSGMVGRGPDGYPAGIEAQTQVVLDRLHATLKATGLDFTHVESATVWLTDIRHYGQMNDIYRQTLPDPPPARATVGSVLMSPDALVEIAMTARIPDEAEVE